MFVLGTFATAADFRFWHKADSLTGLAARPLLGVKQAFSSHRRVLGTLVRLARSPILSIALSQPCSASFIAKPASGRPTSGIAGADYGETIEIDPAYLDVTVKRWQDFTGETVTLGARFDEMILKAVA